MIGAAPTLLTVIKYGFLSLVVTGAGFLIANTAVTMHHKIEAIEDLDYRARISRANDSLDKNSHRCLTHQNRPFCIMSSKRRIQLLRSALQTKDHPVRKGNRSVKIPSIHPIYAVIENFKNLMESLKIKPILLEPSILFCMLPALQKYALITNDLKPSVLRGLPNLVTFGVLDKNSKIMNQETSIQKYLQSGYEFSRSRKWLETLEEETSGDFFSTRYFFVKQNMTLQVVVFFEKQNYLWNPGLSEVDYVFQRVLFREESAFESFSPFPLTLGDGRESGLYLPSETIHFLHHIQHSRFLHCVSTSPKNDGQGLHPSLTNAQLNHRALIAIQELRALFRLSMSYFWLWRDTLSGWKENCNLFHKTFDLDIAVRASAILALNLNGTISEKKYILLYAYHKWENLNYKIIFDCYGLRINVYSTYEDANCMWYFTNNPEGQPTRIVQSKFKLCSTDVMGQLVQLPCTALQNINI